MKSFRERAPWAVGTISLIVLSILLAFAFSLNKFSQLRGVYPISADLRDAANVQPGNEVRIAGVRVGRVTEVSLTDDAARVKMEIQKDVLVPSTTRVEVKLKTLLGQKFIELEMPESFLSAASGGGDPSESVDHFLEAGEVIPISQTRVPFEIYQAATEGTRALEGIDKKALRKMLRVLATTIGGSKDELGRFIEDVAAAGEVLQEKNPKISRLLRNSEKVTATLAASGDDLEGILADATDVFGTLADRRQTISSLLAATNDLTAKLGLLLETSRASVDSASGDLLSVVATVEDELTPLLRAIDELGPAQEMFAQPLKFGRFIEGHVCAITTEDTCVPDGEPSDPGVPVKGTQPDFNRKLVK